MARIEERIGKKGTSYRVLIRMKGYPAVSETFTSKTRARQWAGETEAAMRNGRYHHTAAKRKTLGEAIERYLADVLPSKPKNASNVQQHLKWWKEQLGHALLSQLTPAVLAEKRDLLTREPGPTRKKRSPATVVRYLSSLSALLSLAAKEWMWMTENPLKGVKRPQEPRGRVRFLDENERERLLKVCAHSDNPCLYPAVVLSLATGLRQGELYALEWQHIDLERGFLNIEHSKNGERRGVPIRGLALDLLRQLFIQKRTSTKAFPTSLRRAWDKALIEADVKDFVWHSLRHSCASYLVMSGASITEVAKILGHKQLQMTMRYSHLSEEHKGQVLDTMTKMYIS